MLTLELQVFAVKFAYKIVCRLYITRIFIFIAHTPHTAPKLISHTH